MGMDTLLTAVAIFAAVRQTVPRHSFVTMLDIWMVSVMFFIVSILLEFVIAHFLVQRGQKALSVKLDKTMQIAYPVSFIFLNIAYWPSILTSYYSDPCHVVDPHHTPF